MIHRIWLRNWKSHQDTALEFSRGTNILVGPMGSGKSTVLDALCFALFGNFPALQHRQIKLSDIIMNRPVRAEEAEVKVELLLEDGEYEIERRVGLDGKSEARIRKNGKLIQGPQPQRVNEDVERLLGVDYELFARVVYSEQNRIDYFLTLGRGERKKQIDELLGISKFENVRGNLSTLLNRLKELREDGRGLLRSMEIERIRKEERKAADELERMKREMEEVERKEKEVAAAREEAERELQKMSQMEREHAKLSERKAAVARMIEELERAIEEKGRELGEVEGDEGEMRELEEMCGEMKKAVSQLSREVGSLSERVKVVEEEVKEREELTKRLAALEGREKVELEKERVERELSDASGLLNFSRRRVSELEELISELKKEVTRCPVCDAPLSRERREELLRRREAEREKEAERVRELEKANEVKKRELEKIAGKLREVVEIEERVGKLRDERELEKLSAMLAKSERRLREEESRLKEKEGRRDLVKAALELKKSKRRVEELRREEEEVGRRIQELGFEKEVFERKRERVKELSVEQSRLGERMEGMRKELSRVEEIARMRREEIRNYEELERKVERYGKLYDSMVVFQNAVEETQRELREELIEAINSVMEQMWGVIYPYGDYRGIRLSATENDYELQLNADGMWVNVDGVASGGERSTASIAMRMAFAMVLVPNLTWLILDEPTHNLDEEGRRALGVVLSEHAPKIAEQIFVITHDEILKDAAGGLVYRFWRDKERSGATQVERANILNTAQQ